MEELLEIGIGTADITPAVGCPLSGFISRMGRPSETIDGPLTVTVLAVRDQNQNSFLINYTLLSIGQDLEEKIQSALASHLSAQFSSDRCVLVAVHTHSAPPVSPLEGEFPIDPAYELRLIAATREAASAALESLEPAFLFFGAVRLPGLTYNRRAVLADGRVSLSPEPGGLVLERGPVDDTLTALVWRTRQNKNKAVIFHFACHAASTCTQGISADIPGELMLRARLLFDAPCLYLQGATGDINPTVIASTRPEMMGWIDEAWKTLKNISAKLQPVQAIPFQYKSTQLALSYRPFPPRELAYQRLLDLRRIAAGDLDSPDLQRTLLQFADLMNYQPGQSPDLRTATLMAEILARTEARTVEAIDKGSAFPAPCLGIKVWSMGQVAFVFLSAEVFAITGFRIRALGRSHAVLPVSYASSILGYLPDRESLAKGGYEVDDAWRFYRHPAPFGPDSEDKTVDAVREILSAISIG